MSLLLRELHANRLSRLKIKSNLPFGFPVFKAAQNKINSICVVVVKEEFFN
jgi:hypothetical protein